MGSFSNREIATALWLAAFLAYALPRGHAYRSVAALLRSFFRAKVQLLVWLMVLYSAISVALLAMVGLWDLSLLRDTIMWFCVVAIGLLFRYTTSKAQYTFRRILTDAIAFTVVLAFVVSKYTLSLPVELILVPIVTLLTMTVAYGRAKPEFAVATKMAQWVLAATGLALLAYASVRAFSNLPSLVTMDTVKSIALEPLLTLMAVPFLYGVSFAVTYEAVFIRLGFFQKMDSQTRRYAHRRIRAYAGLSLGKLQHLLDKHGMDLARASTKDDVDKLVQRR